MERLEKRCLMASAGMHLFLVSLLVLGSAFFVPTQKPVDISQLPRLKVVPGKLVDSLLSGGGGNPKIAPSDERIKGETMRPQPAVAEPAPPAKETAPQPKVEPKKVEKVEPKKPDKLILVPTVKNGKEAAKPNPATPKEADILKNLTRKQRTAAEKARQQAEAEAREQARAEGSRRRELAQALGNMEKGLRAGFTDGTVVEVGGPGGEAYANYAQFVKEVYENAWMVPTDFLDENATAKVVVVIERAGNVARSRVEKYSGISSLDRSVERTLQRVKFVAPFPEDSRDKQRSFTINFNLKGKQIG